MKNLIKQLSEQKLLPIIQHDNPQIVEKMGAVFSEYKIKTVELVLRSDNALSGIETLKNKFPHLQVGAGTITNFQQAKDALSAGADFIISPGFNKEACEKMMEEKIKFFPGINTPSELMQCVNMGINNVKFFPAVQSGGLPFLKALASVFPKVNIIPTGGVNIDNVKQFLDHPNVACCGGSWFTPAGEIEKGNYNIIKENLDRAYNLLK